MREIFFINSSLCYPAMNDSTGRYLLPPVDVVEYLGLNDIRGNYKDLRGVNPKYSTTAIFGWSFY